MKEKFDQRNTTIYYFDKAPNIKLTSKRVVWWNEEFICIRNKKKVREQSDDYE